MPFDMSGIERTSDGVLRYTGLARSLLHMFRASVERTPTASASSSSAASG